MIALGIPKQRFAGGCAGINRLLAGHRFTGACFTEKQQHNHQQSDEANSPPNRTQNSPESFDDGQVLKSR
jgi:hypothetical protein